jgi:multidrug resistance protein MdtO
MLVMWFVFDQIWPVRTITALRRVVAAVLKDAARVVALTDTKLPAAAYKRESDTLRDRLGKQLSAARMLNEATEYEFGVGREKHMRAGDILMQISMTTLALIWNQAALLHRNDEANFLRGAAFVRLRQAVAQRLSSLGDALAEKGRFNASDLAGLETADNGSEYSRNTIARYNELRRLARSLNPQMDKN